ncbi:MAG: PIG-L family deacetylase [Actinobacteria bacterium]|nr:PIG-L family deacetylase [Actinomycetota bacterium]MCL6104609.1 PIG-L family deacetylase [Actinomycetota bacterium]
MSAETAPSNVSPPVPSSALAIYAHPDDIDVSCGGTLAKWAGMGCNVHTVICTKGDKGTFDSQYNPLELAAIRRCESKAAAEVMGVDSQHYLEYLDGEVENTTKFREELVGLVRRFTPEVVLSPDPSAVFFGSEYFNHRDHREVGWAVLDSVTSAAALPLYYPNSGRPHKVNFIYLSGTLEPNIWIDISDFIDLKAKAVACHTSQLPRSVEWFEKMIHDRAEAEGRSINVRYAESFRCFDLSK